MLQWEESNPDHGFLHGLAAKLVNKSILLILLDWYTLNKDKKNL